MQALAPGWDTLRLFGGLSHLPSLPTPPRSRPMILNGPALELKRQAQGDFRGRHFEAILIVRAVSWYLRYALIWRDIEEMLLERGLTVDHSTTNRCGCWPTRPPLSGACGGSASRIAGPCAWTVSVLPSPSTVMRGEA
jgi:hypothetical protein